MRSVFVDTSAFVALRNAAEVEHERARAALSALLVRVGRAEAIEWGRRFRASDAIELVRVESEVEHLAWEILERHEDKRWSYVDATSFALIERDGSGEAFAFDADFSQRGLRVWPEG